MADPLTFTAVFDGQRTDRHGETLVIFRVAQNQRAVLALCPLLAEKLLTIQLGVIDQPVQGGQVVGDDRG